MRFKNQVIDGLTQAQNIGHKLQVQVNRGMSQEELIETVEQLKEHLEKVKELVSTEHDDFDFAFNQTYNG
jgi:predicted RNA-binding protein with EMAP domain